MRPVLRCIPLILFLAGTYSTPAQCPASVPLAITGISTSISSCQASGSAMVQASGGNAPYTYSIVSGPVTAPLQSSALFQSLVPGNYIVKVTDNCNTSVSTG